MVRHIKDIPISIKLDESTFGADSTLIVCIRFIGNECIKEELLFVDYFECRCTGQDIFRMVRSYFDSYEMNLSQVVSVSTDGARNMTGRETGFWGCFKREGVLIIGLTNLVKSLPKFVIPLTKFVKCLTDLPLPKLLKSLTKLLKSLTKLMKSLTKLMN